MAERGSAFSLDTSSPLPPLKPPVGLLPSGASQLCSVQAEVEGPVLRLVMGAAAGPSSLRELTQAASVPALLDQTPGSDCSYPKNTTIFVCIVIWG